MAGGAEVRYDCERVWAGDEDAGESVAFQDFEFNVVHDDEVVKEGG